MTRRSRQYRGASRLAGRSEICRDEALTEGEDVRISRVDRDVDPVVIGRSEGFDPREVLHRRSVPGNARAQRPVDAEEMTVTVDQHDRLAKGVSFHLELEPEIAKAARIL